MEFKSKADVLLGLQWGDEGKGKIVDVLTPQYKLIARFQGGPNAGHTLEFDKKKYVLHTIPSGVFHADSINLIGSGVVIDPCIFEREVKHLGLSNEVIFSRLVLSKKAHLIMPSHRLVDAANEFSKGNSKIGSTLKGIGPTYTDKIARMGLRIGDVLRPDFRERYEKLKALHLNQAESLYFDYTDLVLDGMDFVTYEYKWFEGIEFMKQMKLVDTEILVNEALMNGTPVLAEGAQGSLLDIDFGSYPFVTSSNTIAAGACTGLGIAPSRIGQVLGIFKAYCTRVGSGPFPTELFDADGDTLRKEGNEFGSTTGRPRRCGWLDLPALRYSVMLNGVTRLIMTKSDVMSVFERIQVCVAYKYRGSEINYIPFDADQGTLEPVYVELPGWNTDLKPCQQFDELPAALLDYIRFIEDYVKVPIGIVSTGPDRSQTIIR